MGAGGAAAGALRLVLVTPDDRPPGETRALVEAALEGGVTAVWLREHRLSAGGREALYRDLVACCRRHRALSLVSRDAGLAAAVGADGVQLGGSDPPEVATVRARHPGLVVGRSCHGPVSAEDRAADHVTLSPFRPTPRSRPRPLLAPGRVDAVLRDERIGPVVALGGITAADVPDLPAGLAGVAVRRAIADAPDPRGAAAVLRSLADARWSFGGGAG